MKIFSSPTMKHLDNILSYLQREEMEAMKFCNLDKIAAYQRCLVMLQICISRKL